jgi:hypothetical protein
MITGKENCVEMWHASYRACDGKERHEAVVLGTCAQELGYKYELNRAIILLSKSLRMTRGERRCAKERKREDRQI